MTTKSDAKASGTARWVRIPKSPRALPTPTLFILPHPTISNTPKYGIQYFVLAILAALAFPIGVPLCYWFLLWRKRERLNPENMAEEDIFKYRLKTRKLDAIRFLFDMYHARVWWWEVFETLRRIALTGALMVFKEGSILQLFLGVTICVVSLMMYSHYMPFVSVV